MANILCILHPISVVFPSLHVHVQLRTSNNKKFFISNNYVDFYCMQSHQTLYKLLAPAGSFFHLHMCMYDFCNVSHVCSFIVAFMIHCTYINFAYQLCALL